MGQYTPNLHDPYNTIMYHMINLFSTPFMIIGFIHLVTDCYNYFKRIYMQIMALTWHKSCFYKFLYIYIFARGDYCAIPKVSKERRYPYSCNNLFRLWLEAALSLRVNITNSDFLIKLVCV